VFKGYLEQDASEHDKQNAFLETGYPPNPERLSHLGYEMSAKLLIDEPPAQVLKSLAVVLGLEKAIILQQIHWLLTLESYGQILSDDHKYVWKSAREFSKDYFPFWKPQNIQKHIRGLEAKGVLISHRWRSGSWNQTKFYRIDYERLNNILPDNVEVSYEAFDVP